MAMGSSSSANMPTPMTMAPAVSMLTPIAPLSTEPLGPRPSYWRLKGSSVDMVSLDMVDGSVGRVRGVCWVGGRVNWARACAWDPVRVDWGYNGVR